MSLDKVQQNALQTYNENIEFFKQNHPDLYKNLELYAAAIDLGQVVPQFELQYLGNYFDIVNPKTKQFLYGKNSIEISQSIVDGINFDATTNSFKTYYEHSYNDNIAKEALDQDILAPYNIGNAPIVNYVNKNLSNPQNLKEIHKFIIFGVLLGIHIPLIHQKLNSKVYLIVEPNLEFFRLSLFVTNYATLAKQTKLFFAIAQNEFEFKKTFDFFYGELFIFNHYLKFVNLSDSSKMYMTVIQNYLVSQPHILYSYDRTFLSLSRTNSYISQNFKLLNIKNKQSLKPFNKPVLLLAAGPSLQHNIEFVKKNQNYFTIVAIYATLPILERNGIKPDIITQYDEQDIQVLNTLEKLNDINFFNDSVFIFASHVNAKLMNSFPKEKIFIFQAMFELKENFGILTSPSIGELTYALLLLFQTKEIYLLGLDLALDSETGKSHMEGHSGAGAFNELKELEDSSDNNYSFRKNTIKVRGNFIPEIKSVPVFKTSIDTFNQFTEMYKNKDCKVYNLSNGAYLNDTTPLRPTDINFSTFNENQKIVLKKEIFDALENISEIGYNDKDLEKLNLKLSSVKKIKKHIEQFQKIKKYKDFEEYKAHLINLIQNILFEKHNCEDLQSILINFSSHNLHHIFYLFDLENEGDNKKYIYEINKNLCTQLHKIVDTYVVSISYSSDENSIALKKLNKYLKEYSIRNSIYSEPFFKELVETSKRSYQYEFEANSIGFFATEDNLSNKEFISYIKKVLNNFPKIQLKLFYFFDFQKIQAQFIFKQEIGRIELLIPHNLTTIANSVELWFETYNKTINIRKLDDIILNNYENVYAAMFNTDITNDNLVIPEKFILTNEIKDTLTLPNTKYFEFGNSLKDKIDETMLLNKYKEGYISFFALRENLQKEFIENIYKIANAFPNLKFCAFYFDEDVKLEFETHFRLLSNKFEYKIPSNIYDIAENSEVWAQAKIKNQSFLFNKIENLLNKTTNIYFAKLTDEFQIKKTTENYLENLIENYYEKNFNKSLYKEIDINKIQSINPSEDAIGFLATNDNLMDNEFIKLMELLLEKYSTIKFKAFYFNEIEKKTVSNVFEKYIHQIDFIIPKTIYDIVENTSTYIYSFINGSKSKTSNYNMLLKILNKTKANLFKIHLYNEIKNKDNFYDNLNLIEDFRMPFDKSIVSKILYNHKYFNKYLFLNSITTFNPKNHTTPTIKNSIGFIINFNNLQDGFIEYILQLMSVFKYLQFKAFYFNGEELNILKNVFMGKNLDFIQLDNVSTIIGNCSIFIVHDIYINIELYFIKNKINSIYAHRYRKYMYGNKSDLTISEFEQNYDKNYFLFKERSFFNFSEEEIIKSEYSITKLKINHICRNTENNIIINLEDNVHEFYNFKLLEIVNKHIDLRINYNDLIFKIYTLLKVI